MNIAIIGNGNVGQALAASMRQAGHHVRFGVRKREPEPSDIVGIADAVAAADLTILAIPFEAVPEVVAAAAGFAGKILIDATNPLGMGDAGLGLTMGFTTSGAEQIAALAPAAHVCSKHSIRRAFENLQNARQYSQKPVMFAAGDDPAGKQVVLGLISDCGFEAVDAGGLRAARLLEPLAMVWIELGRVRGRGADFAFTLQNKS